MWAAWARNSFKVQKWTICWDFVALERLISKGGVCPTSVSVEFSSWFGCGSRAGINAFSTGIELKKNLPTNANAFGMIVFSNSITRVDAAHNGIKFASIISVALSRFSISIRLVSSKWFLKNWVEIKNPWKWQDPLEIAYCLQHKPIFKSEHVENIYHNSVKDTDCKSILVLFFKSCCCAFKKFAACTCTSYFRYSQPWQ